MDKKFQRRPEGLCWRYSAAGWEAVFVILSFNNFPQDAHARANLASQVPLCTLLST